jgi:hypothetical protein
MALSEPTQAKIKPGKFWYWLGGLLIAAGIIGGIAIGVVGVARLIDSINNFGRFKVENGSGSATVNFQKSGKYSIYYESKSKVCQDLSQTTGSCEKVTVSGNKNPPDRLDISLTNDTGSLQVQESKNSVSYNFGDFRGQEIAFVQVPQPGAYTMTVQSPDNGEFAVAIGKGVVSSILPWVATAALIALVGLALGLIAIIVTAVKRGRRKRAAASVAAVYPTAPPAPVPVGAAPYGVPYTGPYAGSPEPSPSLYAPPAIEPDQQASAWSAPPAPSPVPPFADEPDATPAAPSPVPVGVAGPSALTEPLPAQPPTTPNVPVPAPSSWAPSPSGPASGSPSASPLGSPAPPPPPGSPARPDAVPPPPGAGAPSVPSPAAPGSSMPPPPPATPPTPSGPVPPPLPGPASGEQTSAGSDGDADQDQGLPPPPPPAR